MRVGKIGNSIEKDVYNFTSPGDHYDLDAGVKFISNGWFIVATFNSF